MFQYKDERGIQVIQDFLIFNSFHLKTVTLSKIIRHLISFSSTFKLATRRTYWTKGIFNDFRNDVKLEYLS